MTTNDPRPAGRHELNSFTWPDYTPVWAQRMQNTLNQILKNQEKQMAAIDNINQAITNLKDAVNQALQDLKNQATAGGIGPDDVQSVIDQLNATHDQIIAGLPQQPAPATPPATP